MVRAVPARPDLLQRDADDKVDFLPMGRPLRSAESGHGGRRVSPFRFAGFILRAPGIASCAINKP